MIDFNSPSQYEWINWIIGLFESHNAQTCVVELYADFDVRIERNKTENRLLHKPSKRDLALSENLRRQSESQQRLNSRDGEQPFAHYLKIDNTHLTPEAVATMIKENFLRGK